MNAGPRSAAIAAATASEHRERREAHDIIGHLEHHMRPVLRRRGRSAWPFSPTAVSATPKNSEKMTIGRISLLAHRLEDRRRARDGVTKSLQVERGAFRRRSPRSPAGAAG